MAGWPHERGHFHLKKGAIDPPDVLQYRFFTCIDHYCDDKDGWEKTFAAQSFICLLINFLKFFIPKFCCSSEFLAFNEILKVAKEGETPSIGERIQQAMPNMLMMVDVIRECLQAGIVVVKRLEHRYEAANSIVSSLDISFQVEFNSLWVLENLPQFPNLSKMRMLS